MVGTGNAGTGERRMRRTRPAGRRSSDTGAARPSASAKATKGDRPRKTRQRGALAIAGVDRLRLIAVAIWAVAILFELLALLIFNGTISGLPGKALVWLVVFMMIDVAGVVVATLLWDQAKQIDQPSESDLGGYFLKSQLGPMLSAVAFIPTVILTLVDQDTDEQTKKVSTIAATIALAVCVGATFNFHPTSAEDLTKAEAAATTLGTGTVYWTEFGHVYHLNPNCPTLTRASDVYQGSMEAAFDAGRTRACEHCATEGGSDLLAEAGNAGEGEQAAE